MKFIEIFILLKWRKTKIKTLCFIFFEKWFKFFNIIQNQNFHFNFLNFNSIALLKISFILNISEAFNKVDQVIIEILELNIYTILIIESY